MQAASEEWVIIQVSRDGGEWKDYSMGEWIETSKGRRWQPGFASHRAEYLLGILNSLPCWKQYQFRTAPMIPVPQ